MMELNKYPFSEISSMELNDAGYKFPLGLLLDINLHPACENNPPYNISSIERIDSTVLLTIIDVYGEYVCDVCVDTSNNNSCDYILGVCKQHNAYCGSCVVNKALAPWFDSVPDILTIPSSSLVLAASVVHPNNSQQKKQGSLVMGGAEVTGIVWGDNMTETGGVATNAGDEDQEKSGNSVKTIIVNGIPISGDNVYITPSKNSIVRVVNDRGISIGRVDDL